MEIRNEIGKLVKRDLANRLFSENFLALFIVKCQRIQNYFLKKKNFFFFKTTFSIIRTTVSGGLQCVSKLQMLE